MDIEIRAGQKWAATQRVFRVFADEYHMYGENSSLIIEIIRTYGSTYTRVEYCYRHKSDGSLATVGGNKSFIRESGVFTLALMESRSILLAESVVIEIC